MSIKVGNELKYSNFQISHSIVEPKTAGDGLGTGPQLFLRCTVSENEYYGISRFNHWQKRQ